MNKLCKCGCGKKTKYNIKKKCYNDYIHGHHVRVNNPMSGKLGSESPNYGLHRTEEHKKKISDTHKNKFVSEITKQRMSKNHADFSKENHPLWNTHRSKETKKKIGNGNRDKKRTEEAKQKMRDNHADTSGANNPMYGRTGDKNPMWNKPPPAGSGSSIGSYCKKGYWVRSTWERKFADLLYRFNIPHLYEPKRFVFRRISYRPDFYIPGMMLWIEIKGYMTTKNKIQHELLRRSGHRLLVLEDPKLFEQKLIKLIRGLNDGQDKHNNRQ